MRVHDNGATFTVLVSAREVEAFNAKWPCSTLSGSQRFEYDKQNGDLVDRGGKGDGSEAVALSEDTQRWAEKELGIDTGHFARPGP